jgi:phenylalanyl-tRNA synthetase beta chain
MKISLSWLQDFLEITEEATALGDRLTMVGLAVDGVEEIDDDTILDLDITANRGDCLSHLGVARELGVIYDVDIRHPDTSLTEVEHDLPFEKAFSISIDAPDLCSRYSGRYISGVTIGPSPKWLVKRLEAVGIRSINNVADITNYVLMELGHPLHAFDSDTLEGSRIIVRRARKGETIKTLDGVERELSESMLVIADAKQPVAMAGIMGGFETEISDQTTNVLLESAWFDPISVRMTGRGINLGTEASYRFERGTDIEIVPVALDRAARLIAELAGGQIHRGVIDVYPGKKDRPTASLRRERISTHLGGQVPDSDVDRFLKRLGFESANGSVEGWTVHVPTHRHDIGREEDLLEEVARHYGYDRFPSTIPTWSGQGSHLKNHPEEVLVRDVLAGLGYSETCSIAFSDKETQERFAPGVRPVAIRNPLSENAPILRTSLLPSVLGSLQWNLNRGMRDLSLYEIAKVYPSSGERRCLVVAATGAASPKTVHQPRVDTDMFRFKGTIESLLRRFQVDLEASTDELPSYYHPGRSVRLGSVAILGELHSECEKAFKLRQKTYVAEIAIEQLFSSGLKNIAATTIPKYPAVRRDLSLLVGRQTRYAEIVQAMDLARLPELIEVAPFDKLERGSFPDSHYSLAVTLVFQSTDQTLTDAQVQDFERRILEELGKIGVELRS